MQFSFVRCRGLHAGAAMLVFVACSAWTDNGVAATDAATDAVGIYEPFELRLTNSRQYANPFRDVDVWAELTSSTGKTLRVPGFYDGDGTWVVRVSFDERGSWKLRTLAEPANPGLCAERSIDVGESASHGPIFPVSTPVSKHYRAKSQLAPRLGFAHADGTPFFHAGDTCYPLLALDREKQLFPYLNSRAAQGFSHIRLQGAFAADERFPELWPWGGTRSQPDLDRFNPDYFRRLDRLLYDLRERGLGAEMILESFYGTGGPILNPKLWTRPREQAWLRYMIARYAAFDNVVYWTLANEFEGYPDGVYRLDVPADIDWARSTAGYVKSIDPYHHPVTTHPYMGAAEYISHFGAAPEIDILMLQEHGNEEVSVRSNVTDGTGVGLEHKVFAARALGKPVVVGEFGYEWDGITERGANTTTDLLRRHAWRIVMGGGHFSAGFRSTVYNFVDVVFDITNGGRPGVEQIAVLNHFFRRHTDFQKLEPRFDLVSGSNLCLQGNGEYVVYVPFAGDLKINLADAAGPLTTFWLDTVSGQELPGPALIAGDKRTVTAPGPEMVLYIKGSAANSQAQRSESGKR